MLLLQRRVLLPRRRLLDPDLGGLWDDVALLGALVPHGWRRAVQLALEPGVLQGAGGADPEGWHPTDMRSSARLSDAGFSVARGFGLVSVTHPAWRAAGDEGCTNSSAFLAAVRIQRRPSITCGSGGT